VATFKITDLTSAISLKNDFQSTAKDIMRQDELWKSTCFEIFLRPKAEEKYYEFNFSLTPAWNCYVFDSYRKPQPPKSSHDFELSTLSWQNHVLRAEIKNKTGYREFNVGLTTIIQDKENQLHYLAIDHAGEKPDFHLQDSFILQRGF